MVELIKEEIFTTVKKKRFIILTALLFIGVIANTVMVKTDHWNDLTYAFEMEEYIRFIFAPLMGAILLLSVHRKEYTRQSILQVESHGKKRCEGVFARVKAGCIILFCSYVILALLVLLLDLIFGAGMSAQVTGQLMLRILTDCLAAIATYIFALFFQYLFAFPVFPMIWYAFFMFADSMAFSQIPETIAFKIASSIIPKQTMEAFYTGLVLSSFRWDLLGLLVLQILVPFLLTLLVFKLKKLKEKKPRKKKAKTETSEDEETAAVTAANMVV